MYRQCFRSTWDTTLQRAADGAVFLITGDIPAKWLRDSSAQVYHYLPYVKDGPEMEEAICKLIMRRLPTSIWMHTPMPLTVKPTQGP